MSSFWHWLIDNKQWLFSGVAVAAIGYVASIFQRKRESNNQKVSVKGDSISANSPSAIGHNVSQSVNYQIITSPALLAPEHRKRTTQKKSRHQVLEKY
ncbi:MAG TPA: hypothetical protein VGN44_21075 [Candidatus Angelobacter sp.]|jgi:hypothetical protein